MCDIIKTTNIGEPNKNTQKIMKTIKCNGWKSATPTLLWAPKKSACILVYCFNGQTKCGKISHENSCCLFKLFMVRVKWRIYSSFAFEDAFFHCFFLNLVFHSHFEPRSMQVNWTSSDRFEHIHIRHLADINASDKCEFIIEFEHFIERNINCLKFVFANHKLSNRQFIEAKKTSF